MGVQFKIGRRPILPNRPGRHRDKIGSWWRWRPVRSRWYPYRKLLLLIRR